MAAYSAAWALVPMHLLRNLLTGLVRQERIQASWARVDEMWGYPEQVGSMMLCPHSSSTVGSWETSTSEPCAWLTSWLTEKDWIPKLFQVLAPRYQGQNGGYRRTLQIPNRNKQDRAKMAVIEYKGK